MSTRRRVGTGVAAAAGLIAVTTLVTRLVGFGRWLVFSGTVGGTCVGEAYATANQLPNVLFEVAAGGALAAVVIPLVGGALARHERQRADQLASAVLTWAVTVLTPLAALLALAAEPLADALLGPRGGACGASASHDLTVTMIRVFAPQVPLYGIGIVLGGVLQAHRRFLGAALAPLLSSLVVIASYLVYGGLTGRTAEIADLTGAEVAVLAGGTTLGVVALSLPLLIPVARAGIRLRPTWRLPHGAGRAMARLAGAGVLALVAQQLAVLVTVWVANRHGDTGALNVFSYVQAVYLLPYAVLAVPVATAAFPSMVGSDAPGGEGTGMPDPTRVLSSALPAVAAAGVLGAAVLVGTAPAIGTFFGALDVSGAGGSLAAMPDALVAFAPGLVGFCCAALLQRALYARGDAVRGALAVAAGWLVAALLPVLLLSGTPGSRHTLSVLGWSSTAGMTLSAVLLILLVRTAWGSEVLSGLARGALVAVAAGAVGVALARLLQHAWSPAGMGGSLLVGLLSGMAVLACFVGGVRLGAPVVLARLRHPEVRS